MSTGEPVFKSRTRLYTNFHCGEHNEDLVLSTTKDAISKLLEALEKLLTDSLFIDGVLSGGSVVDLGFPVNRSTSWKIAIKELDKDYAKWLIKLFKSPRTYLKKISAIFDSEGSLCLDIDVSLKLGKAMSDKIFGTVKKDDFKRRTTYLNAMYNTISAAKYIIFKRFMELLRSSPGIEIEDICDIYLVELEASSSGEVFIRNKSNIRGADDDKFVKLWEIPVDKLIP